MPILLNLFIDICCFKANPQDIPSSKFLALMMALLYGVLSLSISLIELPLAQSFFSALVDTTLLIALGLVSLWITGKPERREQTVAALTGTGALLQIIAWPILFWLSQTSDSQSTLLMIPRWGLLILVIWNIVIIGHILRHALSVALPITVGISVLYMYFTIRIASILFVAAK